MSYILEPVDSVEVLTLMDNSTDMTLESNEIAARTMFGAGLVPAAVIEGGMAPNAFVSEHGFSSLVTVHKGGLPEGPEYLSFWKAAEQMGA